ncbi:MAG: tRNA (adenosine(37)-N6)-dimethylallyltransferase MiaA [Corynebacterium provencense]|uniref:tRNA (adenosine(37)-N6)-dimethylallyltransferase MiaA n=1 Tax=Corynebacterium provencense TaxID=1737425 RepID=UPI002989B9CC|nr:tRNA (adenosine(37)-N6)-dimethylallyltransferase MiaA [Corynebacterium provencense]
MSGPLHEPASPAVEATDGVQVPPAGAVPAGSAAESHGGPRPVVVTGPTGSGKTAAALDLAGYYDGEIVNIDSMQLYRGMDIGTAKLPVDRRRGIPHHLFDVLEVTQTASVAAYRDAAVEVVEDIRRRGRTPVIVGGSMMYVQALLDDWNLPPTDPVVRAKWERELERVGVEALHDELARRDPAAAEVIERKDPRRTVRALEVIELTGRPFAASQPARSRPPRWNALLLGMRADADWLNPRLEARVRSMVEDGLLDEVRHLVDRGLHRESTAGKAIGYSQMLGHLAGELTFDEAVDATVTGTRRYARRQRAWFRRDPRILWIDASGPDPVGQARLRVEQAGIPG